MITWEEFEQVDPGLAAFGRERVHRCVSFIATVRADGSPRVHPVTPWIAAGRLLVRMYPSSPKVADLERDPRYALHSMMDNDDGIGGELSLRGRASRLEDSARVREAYDGDEPRRRRYRASSQATRPGEPSGAE